MHTVICLLFDGTFFPYLNYAKICLLKSLFKLTKFPCHYFCTSLLTSFIVAIKSKLHGVSRPSCCKLHYPSSCSTGERTASSQKEAYFVPDVLHGRCPTTILFIPITPGCIPVRRIRGLHVSLTLNCFSNNCFPMVMIASDT